MMSFSVGKIILIFLAIWLVVIILLSGPLLHGSEPDEQVLSRLSRALGELEALKLQNEELRNLLNALKYKKMSFCDKQSRGDYCESLYFSRFQVSRVRSFSRLSSAADEDAKNEAIHALEIKLNTASKDKKDLRVKPVVGFKEPSREFEETRRHVENGVMELWYYLKAELKKLNNSVSGNSAASQSLMILLEEVAEHKRILLHDMEKLKDLDGLDQWREREAEELSTLVQKRLYHLQNPQDCNSARKLVCNLNKGCGYGCQIHHAVYCFIVAYGTGRTFILRSHNWRYAQKGWESVFQPLSETCVDDSGVSRAPWPGLEDTQVVDLPIIDNVRPRPQYIPLAIPKDLSERIRRLHGNPIVWWISQFVKYLLRPQDSMQDLLDKVEEKLGFKHPVVGIHVRRTDKIGTEAAFHGIEEYMEYAEEYYRQLELKKPVDVRRIYLATDDPHLLAESKKKFPNYVFYGDPNIAKSASVGTRYSTESLKGVILDIHMLSKCDYIVCTFSSQVCRLAYEIMQISVPDGSSQFHSLDDIFYFGGQNDHNQIALYDYKPRSPNEIELQKGDIIGIAGNHWDGFSKGINRRTKKSGLYPSYKTVDKIDIAEFPVYAEVDKSKS